jgi:hypothetical protein
METRVGQYMRAKGSYSPETIIPRVMLNPPPGTNRQDLDGDPIHFNSVRMRTFAISGTKCVSCGVEGRFFYKERSATKKSPMKKIYHLNLYAIVDGREILMTHDHTIPRSRGGKDDISNTKTMCFPCNMKKGALLPEELCSGLKEAGSGQNVSDVPGEAVNAVSGSAGS